ncbi:putative sucrase/ferredoxin-like family protein [Aspergillus campestris IBT 28561]|uniref:Sucrase/ferredoxin-like family protein n=1 Tax=Aspergillus campestris (strain IBT 28561) TaxID=1392248 RepID=A0A2I1CY72_ASPC2|nr:putative sucrase/ferredoxin-like family protein [Aspergillus campestris IBT 28561]PKY02564.1 putative sucrase/ferredoxin-like family protein [Aspergillus campestris IBT 28561]
MDLLRRSASLFTPTPSPTTTTPKTSDDFSKAPSPEKLFHQTTASSDGEDCLHDCSSCTIKYPARFDVDQEDTVYGNVDGWATHALVATGKTDWVRDVADEEGSVMEAVEKGGWFRRMGCKLKLSASNIPVPDEYHSHEKGAQPTTVLLLPAFQVIEHVTPALAPALIKHIVSKAPTTTTPLVQQPAPPTSLPPTEGQELEGQLQTHPSPHAAIILLCSQRTRDARCGQSAPLLRRELERHLRPLGLYRDMHDERPGGVGVYFISHVGGHKYSANMIVYRRRDFDWYKRSDGEKAEGGKTEGGEYDEGAAQGIWLARVRPEDCENIVRYTVLQGKVVKAERQLRGGFDRERGLISW